MSQIFPDLGATSETCLAEIILDIDSVILSAITASRESFRTLVFLKAAIFVDINLPLVEMFFRRQVGQPFSNI